MRVLCTSFVALAIVMFFVTGCTPAASVQSLLTPLPPTQPPPVPTLTASPAPSATASTVAVSTPALTATAAITERVKLDDITMYYAAYGRGKPLILLHGAMTNADIWAKQVPVFAQQYRVITPDWRGQGRTTDGEAPLSYQLMATDTLRLMDYLKIDKAYIVGWNFGANIGLELASHHPERVSALVAFGPYMNPEGFTSTILNWFRGASLADLQADMTYDYRQLSPTPEHLPILLEKIRSLALTQPNTTPDELASIKPPTLILDGQNEEILRIEHVKAMAKAMPQAQFILMPSTGHDAPTEVPAVFNQNVLDFLKDK